MKVNFVTLGGASERIDVPPPTLRNWTDQLEEFGVHYTKRNSRNERLYFKEDLDIFEYLRDMKTEYGRKTTTRDLARMIEKDPRFMLRSREDAPSPVEEPSNRLELLNQEDIKELMNSERVLQFMNVIVDQTTKNIKDELVREVTDNINRELEEKNQKLIEMFEESERRHNETIQAIKEGNKELLSKNEQLLSKLESNETEKIEEVEEIEKKKGFWSSLFGS